MAHSHPPPRSGSRREPHFSASQHEERYDYDEPYHQDSRQEPRMQEPRMQAKRARQQERVPPALEDDWRDMHDDPFAASPRGSRATSPKKAAASQRRVVRGGRDEDYEGARRKGFFARLFSRKSKQSPPLGRQAVQPKKRKRSWFARFFIWSFVVGLWGMIAVSGVVMYYTMKLPPIDQLTIPKRPPNIAILASDGSLIANRGETGGSNVPIKELPAYLPRAFVAIEDRRFYQHFGLDLQGLGRAIVRNFTAGRVEQGGSTLTQQLAKNMFLSQDRVYSRKIQEAVLALWLEKKFSKDYILELYLNRVYFGSGAYGVEAASQKYFGKSARNVTLGEAAILAGLVKSPSRLAPNKNPEKAAIRAAQVVDAMQSQGLVTPQMAQTAFNAGTKVRKASFVGTAQYAADWVMDVIDHFIGPYDSDIVVTTSIDPFLQNAAEKALIGEIDLRGDKFNLDQGALVSMAPDGAVRALIGGRNYAESQFNRAVAAKRQPGSSFKPFVYLAAIEKGLTPDTIREDSPIKIKDWSPENYTRDFKGPVTLSTAMAQSINTVAVKLAVELGPKNVARTAQKLGINSPLQANASLALGTSEVSPLEMTVAYASFANGGIGVIPYIIREVKSTEGKSIYKREARSHGRVIEPQHVAQINHMLREVVVNGTGRKGDMPGWQFGGKTGTSQDHRDAWFIGFSSQLVTTVWLGNDDGDSMKKITGSGLPVEIWAKYMKVAMQKMKPEPLPGLEQYNAPAQSIGDLLARRSTQMPALTDAGTKARPGAGPGKPMDLGPSREEKSLLARLFGG